MKYFKDSNGNVFAYSAIQTPKAGLVEMTPAEAGAHLNTPVASEQASAIARADRDARIEAVRWRIERYDDELRLKMLPSEPIEPLLQYVQALRDVPAQPGFPENIVWPTEPESA